MHLCKSELACLCLGW